MEHFIYFSRTLEFLNMSFWKTELFYVLGLKYSPYRICTEIKRIYTQTHQVAYNPLNVCFVYE